MPICVCTRDVVYHSGASGVCQVDVTNMLAKATSINIHFCYDQQRYSI